MQSPSAFYLQSSSLISEANMKKFSNNMWVSLRAITACINGLREDPVSTSLTIGDKGELTAAPTSHQTPDTPLPLPLFLKAIRAWVDGYATAQPTLRVPLEQYLATVMMLYCRYANDPMVGTKLNRYHAAFSRVAARMCRHGSHPNWSAIDTNLENEFFHSSKRTLCYVCLSTTHATEECTPVLAKASRAKTEPVGVCFNYNRLNGSPGCPKTNCIHSHVCSKCKGDHPQTLCKAALPASTPTK